MSKPQRTVLEHFDLLGRLLVFISNTAAQYGMLCGVFYDEEQDSQLIFSLHIEDEHKAYQARGTITADQLMNDEYVVLTEYITMMIDHFVQAIGESNAGTGETA